MLSGVRSNGPLLIFDSSLGNGSLGIRGIP